MYDNCDGIQRTGEPIRGKLLDLMTAYRRTVVIEREGNGVLHLNVEKAEGSIM